MSISRGIDLFLLHAVRKAEKLPQTYLLKSSISSTFSAKLTIVCTLDSLILFFYCPLFEPANRRLQLTRTFDLIFIRFASQCCTIFSIQSKTLMFDAVCPSNSPFLTVDFHMNKQYDWNLENPREFIQSQLVTFAISSESRCAAKSSSILNRLISLPIFHVWWTYLVNHTGFLHPLHSVRFNFCASRESTERPVAGRPRRLLADPSTKMSFSDAKTLLTSQKSK